MLIYKNKTEKDVKLTLPPMGDGDMPTEVVIKPGEEYEIADEQAKFFLNYDLQAKKTENGGSSSDAGDGAEGDKKAAEDAGDAGEDGDEDGEGEGDGATATVKNDREFDVTVTYKEGDKDKTVTVKAGDEIKVPADQEEAVKKQIADAEAAEEADTDDDKDDDEKDDTAKAEEKKLAEEKAKLAEEKRKLLEEKAEMKFSKLCESGKAVPAQRDAYMALAAHESEVTLAEGKTESVSTLLESLFESAPAHSLNEEEGESGDGKSEVELSDEEKEVAERFGNTEEEIKANKEK